MDLSPEQLLYILVSNVFEWSVRIPKRMIIASRETLSDIRHVVDFNDKKFSPEATFKVGNVASKLSAQLDPKSSSVRYICTKEWQSQRSRHTVIQNENF